MHLIEMAKQNKSEGWAYLPALNIRPTLNFMKIVLHMFINGLQYNQGAHCAACVLEHSVVIDY